jgi:hypothetical protein
MSGLPFSTFTDTSGVPTAKPGVIIARKKEVTPQPNARQVFISIT